MNAGKKTASQISTSVSAAEIVRGRRQLGVYYTPDDVAATLVQWAVAGRATRVLEPSFGGCSFLRAAVAAVRGVGGVAGDVVGVDIDREGAARYAEELFAAGLPRQNVHFCDFLGLTARSLGRFGAVVGNPPFVRHHWQSRDWRVAARQRLACESGLVLSQRASAWAYFVGHAVSFLDDGGRMALIVPGTSLQSEYAQPLLRFLEQCFASTALVRLADRLFDAQEEAVILFARDFNGGSGPASVVDIDTRRDLEAYLSRPAQGDRPVVDMKQGLLTKKARALLTELWEHPSVRPLGEIAEVKIGVVTGANDFFVRTAAETPNVHHVVGVPVVARSSWLQAPVFREREFRALEREGRPTRLLLVSHQWRRRGRLAAEIDAWETDGVEARHHCGSRVEWFVLEDHAQPHAFLPYMGAAPKGLVVNGARATCTNAVHRVNFKLPVDRAVVCASTWTAFGAVAAELYGRHYGGGVLKLEPTKAKKLPVVIHVEDSTAALDAAELFWAGRATEGQRVLDREFLMKVLGCSSADVDCLREAADSLLRWRVNRR